MSGHLDFRNHGNETLCGVCHNFLYLFLRVIASVNAAVELSTPSADLLQLGILFDFYAPALVVREVPVHGVELVLAQDVYLLLDIFYAHEVAAGIYVEAPPAEAGGVFNLYARDLAAGLNELGQRLAGIEQAGLVGRYGLNTLGSYGKGIALWGNSRCGIYREFRAAF